MPLSRRDFLHASALAASAAALPRWAAAQAPKKLPRVAAVNSIYRLRSHAYHIAGRFIHGYTIEGQHHQPPFELVRMFNHQSPADDLGPRVCKQHGIELCRTIAETLGGADSLDVDAVLLIVEHGDYPVNELGQIEYPRFELFQEVVDVFKKSGRSAPVFVDKHLAYNHQHAHEMVRTARDMKFGLMAGSSLPVVWRRPEYDPPLETPFKEGLVAFGYDRAPQEIYLFHALEVLQCMLERRRGGETGIKSIVGLRGDAVWKAGDEGRWSWDLLDAALACNPSRNYGKAREQVLDPSAILIEYNDGTRGAVLNVVEACSEFSFAARLDGSTDIPATWFVLPPPPGARFFDPLTYNIEQFFATGQAPYPVERTLLTSTVLDLALHSMKDGSETIASDALDVRYRAPANDGHFQGRWTDV